MDHRQMSSTRVPARRPGVEGFLVVNKDRGKTSHDIVALARRKLGVRRIGHTGTLDPMAEGVLVLLVGAATKYQQAAQAHRKQYEATFAFGTKTETGDAWGKPVAEAPLPCVDRATIEQVLASFVGFLQQIPPVFSAVKVGGRPLYWWARRGTPRVGRPRTIRIFGINLLEPPDCGEGPGSSDRVPRSHLRCLIDCSSGTYVRRLCESIAERLGSVGHVQALVRCAVGSWGLEQARSCEWLARATTAEVQAALQPATETLFASETISMEGASAQGARTSRDANE